MSFNKESAVQRAKADLAKRLDVSEKEIEEISVNEKDFPDMSLGAPVEEEMSAQMISSGWQINLQAEGDNYEYRADKYQLRLSDFRGTNYVVESWNNVMEDKELKKKLAKIPDADKNGDPIYKIADVEPSGNQSDDRVRRNNEAQSRIKTRKNQS